MTPEQITIFVFAIVIIAIALYSKKIDHKVFPEIGLALGVLLVLLGGINPATLKNLNWKQSATGQELSFVRYEPTEKEIKQVLALADDKEEKDISDEPLVKAARERADQNKSAADYLLLATEAWKKKQYDKALRHAYVGLELNPADKRIKASLQHRIASVYQHIGAIEQGIAGYKKAIQTDPSFSWPHNNLGRIYAKQGRYEDSESSFLKAIELSPNDPVPHYNLGNLYYKQGKIKEAESLYLKAIEIGPNNPDTYGNLGNLYYEQGKIEEAEQLFLKAIEVDPKSPAAFTNLGIIYFNQGIFVEAESFFLKVIELSPNDPVARYNLGNFYYSQGKDTEAKSLFLKAIKLDPGYEKARRQLELLGNEKKE